MKTVDLRTSLFSFDSRELAHVYRVQIGEQYLAAWQVLQNLGKKHHPGLPTNSLKELLAVCSGGPVEVSSSPYYDQGASAIIMLRPLPVERINQILRLWSLKVMQIWDDYVEGLENKLAVIDVLPLSATELIGPQNISGLAYHAVPWLVGQAMAQQEMQSSKPIALQQSSGKALLAWDDPILAQSPVRYATAVHVIEPELKLLYGCDEPFIKLNVHLSHTMPNWSGRKKHAWVQTGKVIIRAGVRSRMGDSGWKTHYDFPTNELLSYLDVDALPELVEGAIPVDSAVRPIYASPPSNPLIGSGAGPIFLDQAGFHLLNTVRGARPLLARKAVSSLAKTKAVPATPPVTVHAVVIAAHAEVMLRLIKAAETLRHAMPFFKKVAPPKIVLERMDLADAGRMLEGNGSLQELKQWLLDSVLPLIRAQQSSVAIVETSVEAAGKEGDQDPKHFIRRVLAEHGVVTQFIMHDPSIKPLQVESTRKRETRDFRALNVVTEALRLAGYFPSAFRKAAAIPSDTTLLSVWLERITDYGKSIHLPVITRTILGSQQAQIFWFESEGSRKGKWLEFSQGVAAIHARHSLIDPDSVKDLITQSMLVPSEKPNTPLIVCLDGNLRTFYGALKDSPGQGMPPIPSHAAVVRIRVGKDVAQMSGDHSAHPYRPEFIGTRIGVFQSQRNDRVYYFVCPSKLFGTTASLRKSTRYDVPDKGMQDPWQQLGVTEITVIEPGNFATPTKIAEQVSLLCRNAPMWDGQLRLPSPMHLGAQIANDHPLMEMRRKSNANRDADKAARQTTVSPF